MGVMGEVGMLRLAFSVLDQRNLDPIALVHRKMAAVDRRLAIPTRSLQNGSVPDTSHSWTASSEIHPDDDRTP